MGALEIVLLAAGAIIFIISFCIPVKEEKLKEETRNLAAEEVKSLVSEELETVRDRLTELSEEEMRQQIEKSERSMERISNEKIMAVNEYSDTVLEEIHKNHEEVVFLYDILKNKRDSFSETYDEADKNLQELLQQVKDSEITVRENLEKIAKKQKELEEAKKAMVSSEPPMEVSPEKTIGRKKAAPVRGNRKAAAEPETEREAVQKPEAVSEEIDFKRFAPEKIEVTPKETQRRRAAKKPATETAAPAEDKNVMLLLSDVMESNAAGNSNERILELHKAGKSNMAIARELGLGIGEVKLVIDLYEGLK